MDYLLIDFQEDYFQSLQYAGELADAAPFIEFMLHIIRTAVFDQVRKTARQAREAQAVLENAMTIIPPKAALPAKTAQAGKKDSADASPRRKPDKKASPAPSAKGKKSAAPKTETKHIPAGQAARVPAEQEHAAQHKPDKEKTLTPLEKLRAQARKPSQLKAIEEEKARHRAEAEARAKAEAEPPEAEAPAVNAPQMTTDHQFQAMATALGREAEHREYTSREIMQIMGLSDRKWFRTHYMNPSMEDGFLETSLPKGTTSRNQRYRVTEKGKLFLPRPKRRVKAV